MPRKSGGNTFLDGANAVSISLNGRRVSVAEKREPAATTRCAVCKKKRVEPSPKNGYGQVPGFLEGWKADPFCSASCCRTFHNCQIAQDGRAGTNVGNGQGRRPTPRSYVR